MYLGMFALLLQHPFQPRPELSLSPDFRLAQEAVLLHANGKANGLGLARGNMIHAFLASLSTHLTKSLSAEHPMAAPNVLPTTHRLQI